MYRLTPTPMIERLADGAFIPDDPDNGDYRAYLTWVAQGNTALPVPVAEPPAPHAVTPLQARKALRMAGLKEAADAFIATLPEEQQEEWAYAIEVRRDSPIIAAAAAHLRLDAEQIDALFRKAATFA
ncbi:hypothetical protein [Azospirillum argentinense]